MPDLKLVKNESARNFDAEVRRHRMKIFLRIFIAAAVVMGILLLVRYYMDTKVYTGYEILSKNLRSDSDTAQYMTYNGHILKYSQDGAEAFDGTNTSIWNATYEMQTPRVATCGDYVAMGDEGGTEIIVMDPQGKQTSIRTKLPILNFTVAGQGVVAAVLEDESSARINLYDKEGNLLAGIKSTMARSGYPVDLSLSPSGTLLGVTYVRVSGSKVCSSVAFYNFGDVGRNEIDNYVSGYDYDETLIPRIRFLNNRSAVAVGDDRAIFFSGEQKPESLSENRAQGEIQSVFYGDEKVALVYRSEKGGSNYLVKLYDTRGRLRFQQEFDLQYTDIQLANDLVIIYNDSLCQIYSEKGMCKFDGLFEDSTLLMVPTDSVSKYVLVNRNMIQRIRLD